MTETCQTCRWWGVNSYSARYEQRVVETPSSPLDDYYRVMKAPCVIRAPTGSNYFPLVYEDDYCGEHQPHPKREKTDD